jgi:putative tryptophan/tyrosine transport system substrate-binding protein
MNRGALRRIGLLITLALGFLWPLLWSEAQPPPKVPRIGVLWPDSSTAASRLDEAFRQGLHELGYVEGQTIVLEERWAEGKLERLPDLTAELVRLQVDVIVATYTPVVVAVKKTETQIPVVFVAVSEPFEIGAVASLAHPGGNFTGLTTINRELMPKRLELLKEAIPGLTRVGYLANPTYAVHQPQLHEMQAAAQSLGMALYLFEIRDGSELERAFADLAAAHVGAFIVQQDPLFTSHRQTITQLAAQRRLPGMYIASLFPYGGGFISYGAHFEDLFRHAATYVDKILKGTKPADLPVERPRKFELVLNLKTAHALGLTIPPTLLFQADEVIR